MGCTVGSLGGALYSGVGYTGRVFKRSDGVDKFVKALAGTSHLAATISGIQNGKDHATTQQASKVASAAGDARSITGLVNVLNGVLIGIVDTVKMIVNKLLPNLNNSELVYIEGPKQEKTPTCKQAINAAKEPFQKKLMLAEQLGSLVGGVTYSWAFGVCRVIKFIGKIIGDLGKDAKKMVKTFNPIMFANHIATVISNGAAMWRKSLRMDELTENTYFDKHRIGLAQEYSKEMVSHSLSLGEKGLELAQDSQKIFGAPIGPLPMAIMGAVIGVIGLTKVFVNVYEIPKDR